MPQLTPLLRSHLRELRYAAWVPVYLAVFFLVERIPRSHYWATQLPIDDCIPFLEGFVVFYCMWYFFLVASGLYLLFRDNTAFRRYMGFLACTFFLSVGIWLILPSCQDLRPAVLPRDNLFCGLVAALYQVDTSTDVFPSVHVVGAVGAALAVWHTPPVRFRRLTRLGTTVLAGLICLSTVLIKQHALLDVAGGLLLCAAAAPFFFRHRKSPAP